MLTTKQTILITGISAGIGLQMARLLLRKGHRVIGVGRRPYSSVNLKLLPEKDYFQGDLSDSVELINIATAIKQHIAVLDILLHNAALGYYGALEKQEDVESLLMINAVAPIVLTRSLATLFTSSENPRVVFISSAHSQWPASRFSTYVASKCAIEGFARSLQIEWRNRIDVQVLFPGATATGMHRKAGVPDKIIATYRRRETANMARKMVNAVCSRSRWRSLYLGDSVVRSLGCLIAAFLALTPRYRTR